MRKTFPSFFRNFNFLRGFMSSGATRHWKLQPATSLDPYSLKPQDCLGCATVQEINKHFGRKTKQKGQGSEVTLHEWRVTAQRDTGETLNFSIFDFHGQRWQVAGENREDFSKLFQEICEEVGIKHQH